MYRRTPNEIDEILMKFLGEIAGWNQTTAAKKLNISRQLFNGYYNHRYNPPEELLIEMERLLQAHGIYLEHSKKNKCAEPSEKLPHSTRARQVLADEQWGKPIGRPQKTAIKPINCYHDNNLTEKNKKNRTDSQLAKQYQFKSSFSMRIAILVVKKGCLKLIRAMDQASISFRCAEKLAQLPKPLQQKLLKQGKLAILNYFKKLESVEISGRADIATVLKLAKAHPWTKQQTPATQQSLQKVLEEILYAARC